MPQYRLTATKAGESAQYEFEADDSWDASMEAINYTLSQAMKSTLWAKGRLELWQRGATEPLHVAEEKE